LTARATVPDRSARGRGLLWGALVAAGAALPPVAVLASGRTLVWRDTGRLFQPVMGLVAESVRSLRLPLWNPYEALGLPLFAQMMHGALHPVSLAASLLAPGAGMDLVIVAHVLLAALGAMVLARELGASPAAAAAGGLAYGLSGYVLGMSAIVQYLCAAGTAPWAVVAVRASGRGGRMATLGASLAVAASLLAGDPQWALVASALGLVLAWEASGVRGVARAAATVAIGTALAGVQVVSTLVYLLETRRYGGFGTLEHAMWALSPWRIVEMVAPGFFGGRPGRVLGSPVFERLGGPSQFPMPFAPSVFVGAIPLVLAAAGVGASRAARALGASALVLLWLALGSNLGADQLLGAIPPWSSFRYSEKMVGPLTLCLAILAALGADRISKGPRRGALAAGLFAVGLGGAVAAAALALWPGPLPPDFGAVVRDRLATGVAQAALGLVLLAAALAAASRPAVGRHFAALAAGLVFLQSAAASPYALHAGSRDAVDTHPLQGIRALEPVTRVAVPAQAALAEVAKMDLDEGEWLVAAQSRMGEPSFNVPSRIDQVTTYTGLEPRRHTRVARALRQAFGPGQWIAWRRFGLTHVVVNKAAMYEPEQLENARAATAGGRHVREDPWGFDVWEVPHRPWAFFAEGVVAADSEEEAERRLVDVIASGGPEVVIEGPVPPRTAPGRVLSAERGVDWLRIEAETAHDAVLVVNDAYWPGWRAAVDGRPVEVEPADALIRAVRWPAGRHVLRMEYRPTEVRIGWLVSALGALALAGLVAWRRPPRAP